MSWLYGVSGVLYYMIDLHLPSAWTNVYDFGGNGDGTLLYPGKPSVIGGVTDIPVASIRLKMIRDGFEDYEYMKLVSDLGDPAFAQQTGQALFPNIFAARQPPASVYAAREALAQRILQLKGVVQGGPQLSAVGTSNITASSATVTWASSQPADSRVDYGPTTAYGSVTALDITLVTSHRVLL